MNRPCIRHCLLVLAILLPSLALAEPVWKVRVDPLLAAADFPNLEVDRAISSRVSLGASLWHHDDEWYSTSRTTSLGARLDWFDRGVFDTGWHTNVITKADFNENGPARLRLKGTQSFQWVWSDFLVNAGIGIQLVADIDDRSDRQNSTFGSDSWVYPAWELSIGRAF